MNKRILLKILGKLESSHDWIIQRVRDTKRGHEAEFSNESFIAKNTL